MKFRSSLVAILTGSTLLLSIGVASATTITQTFTFGDINTSKTSNLNTPGTEVIFSSPFSLALFDSALGSLDSVTVNFNSLLKISYTDTVTNPSTTVPKPYNLSIIGEIKTLLPSGDSFEQKPSVTRSGTIPEKGSPVKLSGSQTLTTSDSFYYTQPDLVAFIGTGNFTGTALADADITDCANSSGSTTAAAAATLEVIYDYTPVPEPGTMVLLGFGVLGIAVYSKRRMNDIEA